MSFGRDVKVTRLLALAYHPAAEDKHFTLSAKFDDVWSTVVNDISNTEVRYEYVCQGERSCIAKA